MLRSYVTTLVFVLSLSSCGDDSPPGDRSIAAAEAYVDAFYSYDPGELRGVLASAEESLPKMLFYQGWAEGGNYEIVERFPCAHSNDQTIDCSITVKDDLMSALGIDFNVTDTFHMTVVDGHIVSVTNSSNDPQAYWDAEEWVRENRPELIELPCKGFFDGGATPGDCVRAMVSGYAEYASQSRPLEIGLGTNVATQDLPVMESTIEYLISEMSASQPFPLLERTLDYGHDDYPSKWDACIRGEGPGPELVKDFRVKAHNSVPLPLGFGADLGVVLTKPSGVVSEPGFLYAFTRPGFTSDINQALIYVEARAPVDGWGMHFLLERVGAHWKVTRAFCRG